MDIRRIQWLIALAVILGFGVYCADRRYAERHGEGNQQIIEATLERDSAIARQHKAEQKEADQREAADILFAIAKNLREKAAADSAGLRKANDSLTVMRKRLVLTDTVAVKEMLDSYQRANDHNNAEITRLWGVLDARDSADAMRDAADRERAAKEAAMLDRIRALEKLNDGMKKLVPGKVDKFVTAAKWIGVGYGLAQLARVAHP